MSLVPRRSELAYPTLSDGVIARYCPSLTGPTGNRLYDLSGNNLNGVLQFNFAGTAWERSQGEIAFRTRHVFSDESCVLPSRVLPLGSLDPFSSSVWFNTRVDLDHRCMQDTPGAQSRIFVRPGGREIFVSFKASGGVATLPTRVIQVGKWHHVAVTIGGDNIIRAYVDGEPCSTVTIGGSWLTTPASSREIRIGTNPSGGGRGWDGWQDDIAFYNRVLTPREVRQLASQRGAAYKTLSKRTTVYAVEGERTRSESHTLGLTQTVDSGFETVPSTLTFAQSVTFFKVTSPATPVTQSLTFTQSVVLKGYETVAHFMLLNSIAESRIGLPVAGFFINQSLGFVEHVSRGQDYGVNQTLAFVQNAFRVYTGNHNLSFTQVATMGRGKGATSLLSFTQAVILNSRLNRAQSQPFGLLDSAAYYYDGRCARSRYSRFEGSGLSGLIPVKPYTQKTPVSFESLTGPKQMVPVRTPEGDNKHRLGFDRVNRETSGGELEVYRDPSWVPTETLLFTIIGIKTATFSTLKTFMYSTLGTEILFNDWLGATWAGVITNPDEPATEDLDGYWTLAFEFVGRPYAGPPAFAPLALSQTATFTL